MSQFTNMEVGMTPPISPITGSVWFNTGMQQANIFNGNTWIPVAVDMSKVAVLLQQISDTSLQPYEVTNQLNLLLVHEMQDFVNQITYPMLFIYGLFEYILSLKRVELHKILLRNFRHDLDHNFITRIFSDFPFDGGFALEVSKCQNILDDTFTQSIDTILRSASQQPLRELISCYMRDYTGTRTMMITKILFDFIDTKNDYYNESLRTMSESEILKSYFKNLHDHQNLRLFKLTNDPDFAPDVIKKIFLVREDKLK